jgi:initiation factor 1A
MTKNTHGGNGHKKFARKHTVTKPNFKLRIVQEEGEMYSIVTKMLGNNMFLCHCLDNKLRLGHIRGKFSGRGKRDNIIIPGTWVLIGLREWDINSKNTDKIQQCDLLEVYSDSDKEFLKDTVDENWLILINNDVSRTKIGQEAISQNDMDCTFKFVTDKDLERERFIEEMKSDATEKITLKIQQNINSDEEEQEIDISEI